MMMVMLNDRNRAIDIQLQDGFIHNYNEQLVYNVLIFSRTDSLLYQAYCFAINRTGKL